ncbi:MAG: group II intron maturase-specific domain-containing protein [Syntrophorhabdales bacterium]|jgi:hypothetical protein
MLKLKVIYCVGGVLSPLLANIALSVIEERYERWVHRNGAQDDGIKAASHIRLRDKKAGRPVFFPIRYADDFVVLVSGSYEDASKEAEELAAYLKDTAKLELSKEKTKITPIMKGFDFLGHRVFIMRHARYGYSPRIEIQKRKVLDVRYRIKQWTTGSTTVVSLAEILRRINPIVRGWSHFFRYGIGAKRTFYGIDWYVRDRLWRWMRKKHPDARVREIMRYLRRSLHQRGRKVWREGKEEQFLTSCLTVQRYRLAWMRRPDYALISGEPSA